MGAPIPPKRLSHELENAYANATEVQAAAGGAILGGFFLPRQAVFAGTGNFYIIKKETALDFKPNLLEN